MLKPVIVLIAAVAICAGVLLFGPDAAEALRVRLPEAQATDMALVETLFTLLIFGGLILIGGLGALASGRNAFAMGRRPGLMLAAGLLVGLIGMLATTLYTSLAGTLSGGAPAISGVGLLLWGLALVVVQAGAEEVYFRGWVQPVLQARWGAAVAIAVSAFAFAALHFVGGARDPMSLLNLFLGGVMFGLVAARGGGIAGALGLHVAWNATEQLLVGLTPNPGIGSFGALADFELSGAALWGGSQEGLNASAAMTVVMLAITVPLAILSYRGRGMARVAATDSAAIGSGRSDPALP